MLAEIFAGIASEIGINVVKDKLTDAHNHQKIKESIEEFAKANFHHTGLYDEINFDGLVNCLNDSLLKEIQLYIFDIENINYMDVILKDACNAANANNEQTKQGVKRFIEDVLDIIKKYYSDKLDGKYKLLSNITRDNILKGLEPFKDELLKKFDNMSKDISYIKNNSEKILGKLSENKIPIPKIITVDSAPHPTAHFIGRQAELDKIKNLIKENKNVVLVSGMGGIGKSEICKMLFHEYKRQEDENIKHIGWVVWNGNLKTTFVGNFLATKETQNAEECFEKTKQYINNIADSLLLFIDNMNNISKEDEIELNHLACNIIITSRLNEISNLQTVSVGELSDEECVFIYNDILKRSNYNDEIIKTIVEKSGRLTIVVELLAKTAKTANLTDENLLNKLEQNGFNLAEIKKKIDKDKCFNENLSSLFDLSGINNKELLVLKQFSLFPPLPLSFEYAGKWFEQENNPDILNNLANKGWLIKTETGFYMHHVISDVVKYENAPKYEECANLLDMISEDLHFEDTEMFTSRLGILPFAEKIVIYFYNKENVNITTLLHIVAELYILQASYDKALSFLDKALIINERAFGKEHPKTATTYNNMAGIYRDQGNYVKALEFFDKALAIRENVFGKEHPDTATIYNNIAVVLHGQGNYAKALEFYNKALAIYEKTSDKEYSIIAKTYNNIAVVYHNLDNDDKALEFYYNVLKYREKALDKEHPDTATTYNCIAAAYESKGNNNKALNFFKKALVIREKILGKEHPDTARTYNGMAVIYHKQGNYDKALNFYGKALTVREKVLGKKHPDTATTYCSMAWVYYCQRNYSKALEWHLKSYKINYTVFMGQHPSTINAESGLKYSYFMLNPTKNELDFRIWLAEQLNKE
jgi:tetratricopeptide (TPR) repeat protein